MRFQNTFLSRAMAFAMSLVGLSSFAQDLSTMTPTQAAAAAKAAQSEGSSFGSTSMTTGVTAPSNIATKGMAPGADNIMGSQYTGSPDPNLTNLSTSASMVNAGQAAKNASVSGFTSYSNDRTDQGNQAAYYLTSTPSHKIAIDKTDPVAMAATGPATPTGMASSTSTVCTTTVANLPFDPGTPNLCNETYNQYATSCSLDKKVSLTRTPDCNAAITSNTLGMMSHGPTIGCGTSPYVFLNLGTTPGEMQCHSGSCSSTYSEFVMAFTVGQPTNSCQYQAVNYLGTKWGYMCATYDGANTITVPQFEAAGSRTVYGIDPQTGVNGWITVQTNPGGVIKFSGGHYTRFDAVDSAPVDNCLSITGLVK